MQTRDQRLKYLRKTIETLWHGENSSDGDYPTIVSLLKEVIKLDPKDRDAWENMVYLMWSISINKKDPSWLAEAEVFVKRYLSVNPNGYRGFEYVGQFYRMMKIDNVLALRYYESAIRWKDAPPSTHHSLIQLCLKNKDKIRALGYCKMTLARFPKDPYTINQLNILKEKGIN